MSNADVSQTRPSKRTRLSADDSAGSRSNPSGSSSTSSTLRRHPDVWFDDGNIVLVAQGTGFRVYRGLLAVQSTVLSDMFASSSGHEETFHGCPIVQLSDSPHDLAHFLCVLLPMSRIHYHVTRANPMRTFAEVSAVIRLARKYNIQQVQDQALAFLQEASFPTSFAVYSRPSPQAQIVLNPVHNIGVVNLARLTDTPSLLPLALFRCVFLGGKVFDGYSREDGTVERLPEADLRRCFDARAVLTDERTLLVSRVFDATPSGECATRSACVAELRRVHDLLLRSDLTRLVNPLDDWRASIQALGGRGAPCKPCKQELLERNRRERKRIFDSLPETFGITVEGWGAEQLDTDVVAGDEQ